MVITALCLYRMSHIEKVKLKRLVNALDADVVQFSIAVHDAPSVKIIAYRTHL